MADVTAAALAKAQQHRRMQRVGRSAELAEDAAMAAHGVDFENISLYIPLLQTTVATLAMLATGIAATKAGAVPNQSFAAMMAVGAALVRKPFRIGYARGADAIFEALRPGVFVWLLSVCFQQLSRACAVASPTAAAPAVAPAAGLSAAQDRRPLALLTVTNLCALGMVVAGFVQTFRPGADSDAPLIASASALFCIVLFAAGPFDGPGPLCEVGDIFDVGARFATALSFSCTFGSLVYASPPERYTAAETFVCFVRSTGGSAWTLIISTPGLILAPCQCIAVVYLAVREQGGGFSRFAARRSRGLGESDGDHDDVDDDDEEAAKCCRPDEQPLCRGTAAALPPSITTTTTQTRELRMNGTCAQMLSFQTQQHGVQQHGLQSRSTDFQLCRAGPRPTCAAAATTATTTAAKLAEIASRLENAD